MAAAPPFKVKAIYAYDSPHEDDLSFPEGQIINVTEEEDADWYVGDYTDASGASHSGLFPKNFVERFEPQAPPRPTRRPKVAEAPVPAAEPQPEPEAPKAQPAEVEVPAARDPQPSAPVPIPAPAAKAPAPEPELPPAPKPTPAAKQPPPVSAKPSSFKDRIAAFNQPAAAPLAPFKPGGSSAQTFIKKPFVAPPPSRNAYVPPTQPKPEPHKIYRRDEDPEIAEQQAEAEQAAERAGMAGTPGAGSSAGDEAEAEDAPKMSLKERIAALQKQQAEQASRRADLSQKKKPERPPKKRVESHEAPAEGQSLEQVASGQTESPSMDTPRGLSQVSSRGLEANEPFSDGGNDADMSAAGENTEDAGASSTSIDDDSEQARKQYAAPSNREPQTVQQEEDEDEADEEGDEEDEMDEEARRQQALRERMAKLSGGMGMAGVFGGMPQPTMGGGARKKRQTTETRPTEQEESAEPPPQHSAMRMVPIPGMGRPPVVPQVEKDDEDEADERPVTSPHDAEEVPDVEDTIKPPTRSSTDRPTPPVPSERPIPSVPANTDRGAPPPVPGERPGRASLDSRPVPPHPGALVSATEGSEGDDEDLETSREDMSIRSPPPPAQPEEPRSPPQSPAARGAPLPVPMSPRSPTQDRGPPPLPPTASHAPPPLPPSGPPSRAPTGDLSNQRKDEADRESEYEGDYDTDIASSAKHKDALKHTRDDSLDDTTADEASVQMSPEAPRAVPVIPGATRGAPPPPPPPHAAPDRRSMEIKRQSIGSPRAAPPVPVPRQNTDMEEDEYDPYRYSMGGLPPPGIPPPQPAAPRKPPPPPSSGVPQLPPLPVMAEPEQEEDEEREEEEEEDEVFQPPPRRSTDRMKPPPGPPPPPQERSAPPPPPHQTPIHPSSLPLMPGSAPNRRSMDPDSMPSRRSTDIPRPSHDAGFIAQDIDLGKSSYWWAQPHLPPPALQNKRDILFEIEENMSSKSGTVFKTIYVLYQDYSQTVVTAQYDVQDPSKVSLEQRQERPPERLRQDQLEDAHTRFGRQLSALATRTEGSAIGDGSSQALILELLAQLKGALFPIGTRAYGALVYQNIGNATVQQFDEIRAGDVVSFRHAKFSGKHGSLHTKYSQEVGKPDHVAIVAEWDGTKKKVRGWEQGRDSEGEPGEEGSKNKGKTKGGKPKVKQQSFRLDDLRSGEVRVWRIMPRSWVGWDGAASQ